MLIGHTKFRPFPCETQTLHLYKSMDRAHDQIQYSTVTVTNIEPDLLCTPFHVQLALNDEQYLEILGGATVPAQRAGWADGLVPELLATLFLNLLVLCTVVETKENVLAPLGIGFVIAANILAG